MKKVVLMLFVIAAIVVSCDDTNENISNQQESQSVQDIDMSDFYLQTDENELSSRVANGNEHKCYSMNVLNRQLKENPGLYNKMYDVEYHTRKLIAGKKGGNGNGNGGGGNGGGGSTPTPYSGTVTIPVYVHVIYSNSAGNLSDSRINSQISVLNADYNDSNYNDIPSEFQGVAANTDIHFTLNSSDIARHSDSTSSWGTNDAVKSAYPPVAGYLNMWVCNIGGGILGYAQFPGGSAATDGVVIGTDYFGVTGGTYGLGRTATHEVGHWLNLRHIWGDGRCRQDDFVADTPSSDRANYGCPSYPTVHCRTNDMTMNYMDYTDDACMNMFTDGQNDRMRTIFAAGGARENFVN